MIGRYPTSDEQLSETVSLHSTQRKSIIHAGAWFRRSSNCAGRFLERLGFGMAICPRFFVGKRQAV